MTCQIVLALLSLHLGYSRDLRISNILDLPTPIHSIFMIIASKISPPPSRLLPSKQQPTSSSIACAGLIDLKSSFSTIPSVNSSFDRIFAFGSNAYIRTQNHRIQNKHEYRKKVVNSSTWLQAHFTFERVRLYSARATFDPRCQRNSCPVAEPRRATTENLQVPTRNEEGPQWRDHTKLSYCTTERTEIAVHRGRVWQAACSV